MHRVLVAVVLCCCCCRAAVVSRATGAPLLVRPASPFGAAAASRIDNVKQFVAEYYGAGVQVRPGQELPALEGYADVEAFQQFHRGVPVRGAGMKVVFDGSRVVSASAKLVTDITVDTTPSVAEEEARARAVWMARLAHCSGLSGHAQELCRRHPVQDHEVKTTSRLIIYRTGLTTGFAGANSLAWEFTLTSPQASRAHLRHDFQYTVVVDALKNTVLSVVPLTHYALSRQLREYPSALPFWQEGDPMPSDYDATSFLKAAGDYYNTLFNMFGWKSFDNADSQLIGNLYMDDESICPNAFFDPSVNMTYFCTNLSRYDVATHELGHALTSSLDNGLYEYASGALQESWSDIIAETFSQFWNGSGYYPPRNSNRSCVSSGDSKRWIVGDDCELFDNSLRDLYNPQCTGLPSTVSEMQCYPYDLNGVHTNCGPPSLAYALLADGGVFHGVSFTGIGLLKAWHIFFYAKYYYQLPSETFSDYATHLAQACRDIIGHPLKDQYGATAADIVSSTDCSTLSALLDAVGLDDQPCTTYTLWGAYPSYLPTTGSIVNILTAGCPTATEYLKIGTKTLDAQEYLFSQLGSTSGWNCLAEFNVPSYDRIGTSSPSSNVSFTVSADQAQTTKPVLDATYSLPQRIVYFSTPVISSVSPSSGDENGGYSVTLVGTGFQKFAGPCSPYIGTSYDCLICRCTHTKKQAS
eukprot:TRINITY_DN1693_c0_g1_i3.p1 TRINITY_DN1693_c0_g1~~TRINITY_DN1693_c0_g1_i3.p1  ORF type:complete len:708 (-),score=144.04 TRINITY_DN1693_c0_g1_i3:76-2163(-)